MPDFEPEHVLELPSSVTNFSVNASGLKVSKLKPWLPRGSQVSRQGEQLSIILPPREM
jgi:hypothetical protein